MIEIFISIQMIRLCCVLLRYVKCHNKRKLCIAVGHLTDKFRLSQKFSAVALFCPQNLYYSLPFLLYGISLFWPLLFRHSRTCVLLSSLFCLTTAEVGAHSCIYMLFVLLLSFGPSIFFMCIFHLCCFIYFCCCCCCSTTTVFFFFLCSRMKK